MIKRIFPIALLLGALCLSCLSLYAQDKVYIITTCPGEDTRTEMNVSWAADTTSSGSYLIYTKASDRKWKKAKSVMPEQYLCPVFDSIYSKTATGENFYESALFLKCNATLSNLTPNTEYAYKVISAPENGDTSAVHYFKTSGAQKWSACIISDFHTYPPLPKRLEAAMGVIDKVYDYDNSIDWILHVGDVCAWGGSFSFWKQLYQEEYFKKYMWAGVNGNHDNMTRKYLLTNDFFRNANYYPRNGYKGEEGVCYYFKYNNALFVMLNNENMRSDEGLAAAKEWVRQVVTSNPAKYVIVCEHYQWFFGESGKSSQYSRWSELFDELGVDLAIAGNNHIYLRTGALYGGKETDGTYGTVYVQTPSSDNERGVAIKDSITENKEIIKYRWSEGEKTVGAMHIKVTKKGMTLLLMNRNGEIIDKFTVL